MNLIILVTSLVSFLVVGNIVNADDSNCPALFQRYCSHHSYCLSPNQSCEILAYYPVNEDIKKIVHLHNMYRNQVATGRTGLPQAANMLQMQWDPELAAVAQKYADQCRYEHDPSNCRRVMNFGVGQNIAIQRLTGGHTVPQADWDFAVNDWFHEIIYFNQNDIYPFQPPSGSEYRHFSQLAWANSFRVGCGYVLYKEGNVFKDETYTRLYICNYGPAGNVYGSKVYEIGAQCSNCPINTCCGSSCTMQTTYSGLCRRTNEKPPIYPPPMPNLFYCAFQNNTDCNNYIMGNPNWVIEPTLGGNYLGIVLNGGENSTIVFTNKIQPQSDTFCVTLHYRKGPNKYDDEMANEADEVFYLPEVNYTVSQPLMGYPNPVRQQFSVFNITLSWDKQTELKISFAVPSGKPAQFLNIKKILAVDGKCEN